MIYIRRYLAGLTCLLVGMPYILLALPLLLTDFDHVGAGMEWIERRIKKLWRLS